VQSDAAEELAILQADAQRPGSPAREPPNRAVAAFWQGLVARVHVGDQIVGEDARVVAGGVGGDVWNARQDDDEGRDFFRGDQRVHCCGKAQVFPLVLISAQAVQQVERRVALVGVLPVARRQVGPERQRILERVSGDLVGDHPAARVGKRGQGRRGGEISGRSRFGGRRAGGEVGGWLGQRGGRLEGRGKLGRRGFQFGRAGARECEKDYGCDDGNDPPESFHTRDYTPAEQGI